MKHYNNTPEGGMSYEEIADILGCSSQNVQQTCERALAKLALMPELQAIARDYNLPVEKGICRALRQRQKRRQI